MKEETLSGLLSQNESAVLEFKRSYLLDGKGEAAKRHRDEFVKDVLSLANGNVTTASETACLIIGADDRFNEEGNRELFDTSSLSLTRTRILDLVNSACEPSLPDVFVDELQLDGKIIHVITIPPSPYLHETTRELITPNSKYEKYVVFTRHNDSIQIASARERETLAKLKRIHAETRRHVRPTQFGLISGAIAGSATGIILRGYKESRGYTIARATTGAVFGGFIGAATGRFYSHWTEIYPDLQRLSPKGRFAAVSAWAIGTILIARLADSALKKGLRLKKSDGA